MNRYRYLAKDIGGKEFAGTMEAESKSEFLYKLKAQNLFCVSFEESDADVSRVGYKIKPKERVVFCRQMGIMLQAGITVIKALEVMYQQAVKKGMRELCLRMYQRVQTGISLSDAMQEYATSFPRLMISMIRAGETGGTLDTALLTLSEHYDQENKLRGKVRSAMIYPIILVLLSVAVVTLLLLFVLPNFFTLFEQNDTPLPLPTQILVGTSNFLQKYWYLCLLGIGVVAAAIVLLFKRPDVRLWFDRVKIRIPFFGKLVRTVYTARFARAMCDLYTSGISLIEAIEIAGRVLGNTYVGKQLEAAVLKIQQGSLLSESLAATGIFGPLFGSMLYVGEESGSLDQVLTKTASFFDEESTSAMQKMVSVIEPILIITLGIIIAFIVVSVLLPIYGMYKQVG